MVSEEYVTYNSIRAGNGLDTRTAGKYFLSDGKLCKLWYVSNFL